MGNIKYRSVDREYFVTAMSELHEKSKKRLQDTSHRYKKPAYLHMKEVNFEVGDMVLGHLRRERFLAG